MNAIEITALSRTFGKVNAVNELNLCVPEGSIFALIGPNGAGKTTTIKVLTNLITPTGGRASVLGTDSRRLGIAEWQRIGYVSEGQRLPDWMSAADYLAYCRPFYPLWDDALCHRLQLALGLTGRQPLRALSRGTRMKAALLSSLAYRPDLLVLDEPFSGLDPVVRDEVVRAMLEVPRDRGWTVFLSSHDVEEVERLADWIGFMAEGRLLLAEPVDTLLNRFRLVEVIAAGPALPLFPPVAEWLPQGGSGRTLRFVDTSHDDDAPARIAAAFPGAAVQVSRLGLRDIFLSLAQRPAPLEFV